MGRSGKTFKKRIAFNFAGRRNNLDSSIPSTSSAAPISASSRKLGDLNDSYYLEEDEKISTNVILDLNILSSALEKSVLCQKCNKSGVKIMISGQETGLAVKLTIYCELCSFTHSFYSSQAKKCDALEVFTVNTRFVYALRSIGKGSEAGKMLYGVMNLPQPPTKFGLYNDILHAAAKEECTATMAEALEDAIKENGGCRDIPVALDGSWQKRGYNSNNSAVTATAIDTGKVIDIEVLSKFCVCKDKTNHDDNCIKNFSGTSGNMEVEGALEIFSRSVEQYNARYVTYLGDGDSKAFLSVNKANFYGDECPVQKIECVGHVMKRMGTRLRRMVKTTRTIKLSDGKSLSGRGRLTDAQIDKLQTYYGLAIRRNPGHLKSMRQAVWAIYLHKISTDDDPNHGFCPIGPDSWCGFNKAVESGQTYHHKNNLPIAVMEAIKPHFIALSDQSLLKKCLHGKTQNVNESLNNIIWSRIPKTVFVQLRTLRLGVYDAVSTFNKGNIIKCNILRRLGISPGKYCVQGMRLIDMERLRNAERASLAATKQARTKKRNQKRALEEVFSRDTSKQSYGAGLF